MRVSAEAISPRERGSIKHEERCKSNRKVQRVRRSFQMTPRSSRPSHFVSLRWKPSLHLKLTTYERTPLIQHMGRSKKFDINDLITYRSEDEQEEKMVPKKKKARPTGNLYFIAE